MGKWENENGKTWENEKKSLKNTDITVLLYYKNYTSPIKLNVPF